LWKEKCMNEELAKRRNEILSLVEYLMSNKRDTNNINKRAFAVNRLEKLTGSTFKNSKEFDEGLVEIRSRVLLSHRLEEKRIADGLTIKQLAKKLGIQMGAHALEEMEKCTRKMTDKVLIYLGELDE